MAKAKIELNSAGIRSMLRGIEAQNACRSAAKQMGASTGTRGQVDSRAGRNRAVARYTTENLSAEGIQNFANSLKGQLSKRNASPLPYKNWRKR